MTDRTIVSFLLDKSGSMEAVRDDTIGGFNAYLGTLRGDGTDAVDFSLVLFDSASIEKRCVGKAITEVEPLTRATYVPGAATPLIDACMKTIRATEEAVAKAGGSPKVIVVFQTDGQENASREFKLSDLQDAIKAKTAEGWGFVYLGCGFDAYGAAASIGIGAGSTMSYGQAKSAQAFAATAHNTRAFMSTGNAADLSYSTAQKAEAGDVWNGKAPIPPVIGTAKVSAAMAVDDFSLSA